MRKEWLLWLWVCFYTELKQIVLNLWYVKTMGVRRGDKTGANPGGAIDAIVPPKTYELTLFTTILYNSENSIRNTKLFCHPLFCHRSVVKYISSLLKSEPVMRLD